MSKALAATMAPIMKREYLFFYSYSASLRNLFSNFKYSCRRVLCDVDVIPMDISRLAHETNTPVA